MTTEIAIVKNGMLYRVVAPAAVKIWNGSRLGADFDMMSLNGDFYLPAHVLELAERRRKGFRLVGVVKLPGKGSESFGTMRSVARDSAAPFSLN